MKNNATEKCDECLTGKVKYRLTLTDLDGNVIDAVGLCAKDGEATASRVGLITVRS